MPGHSKEGASRWTGIALKRTESLGEFPSSLIGPASESQATSYPAHPQPPMPCPKNIYSFPGRFGKGSHWKVDILDNIVCRGQDQKVSSFAHSCPREWAWPQPGILVSPQLLAHFCLVSHWQIDGPAKYCSCSLDGTFWKGMPLPLPLRSITLVSEFITDGFFSSHFRVPASSSQDQPHQTQVWPRQGTQTGADDNQHTSKGNAEKASRGHVREGASPAAPRLPIPATQHWMPGLQAPGGVSVSRLP